MGLEESRKALTQFWQDPIARTNAFFGKSPFYKVTNKGMEAYQLGVYLSIWGEVYGQKEDARTLAVTGRGTGKTSTWQELNAADIAVFMPYFLQIMYGEKKPIDVTIIFVANVKKGSRQRLEYTKNMIRSNPYLEKNLVDYKQWTKENVVLKNGTTLIAESASDRARGYHSRHPKGKVIYLFDEFAFWGGIQCMDGQKFTEEVAEQSFGAIIGAFTTPYGKRGGAWWAYNHPDWTAYNFPTWANPRADKRKLAKKVKQLLELGRQVIVDQEIRGLFVEDAGLFFTMEIWMKSLNSALDWEFGDQQNDYHKVLRTLSEMDKQGIKKHGYYLLGCDPNKGIKKAGTDPFGINLTEKIGKKYYNRFTGILNGRSHEEIVQILKLICKIYSPEKINFDGGGGFASGPIAMLRGAPGAKNIAEIEASQPSIVRYMSVLRALMITGRYEQPPSEDLRESQLAMRSIGEVEDMADISSLEAGIKFQTDRSMKTHGIPCDLAAMGVAIGREHIGYAEISAGQTAQTDTGSPKKHIETTRVYQQLTDIFQADRQGIKAYLTGVGI